MESLVESESTHYGSEPGFRPTIKVETGDLICVRCNHYSGNAFLHQAHYCREIDKERVIERARELIKRLQDPGQLPGLLKASKREFFCADCDSVFHHRDFYAHIDDNPEHRVVCADCHEPMNLRLKLLAHDCPGEEKPRETHSAPPKASSKLLQALKRARSLKRFGQ